MKIKQLTHCTNCNKEIYRIIPSTNNKNYFCSVKCQSKYRYKLAYEKRKCEFCNKEYDCAKVSTQRFCCTNCQKEWQKGNVGIKNNKFSNTQIICNYCNKKFLGFPYMLKDNKKHFCCKDCSRKWFAEIYSQTDETKNRSRKIILSCLEQGIIKQKINSSIQIKINNLLDSLNIKYINEYNCKYYSIDNYLSEYNLMIEVMGDYWHCNPNCFDVIKDKSIYKNITRDKAKNTYIKKQYNINILYLWEVDINKNINVCKSLILEYIKNKNLNNYNSFNYSQINGNLILNKDIIYPYFEIPVSYYKNKIQIA